MDMEPFYEFQLPLADQTLKAMRETCELKFMQDGRSYRYNICL
jgi:hypothetical protein